MTSDQSTLGPMDLDHAPLTPFMDERVPGMAPVAMADWLHRDDAFAPQMAHRDHLVRDAADIVLAGEGCAGADDLLALILRNLEDHDAGYDVSAARVRRPDGAVIEIDRERPFATMARLVQEDVLILEKRGAEHVLIGAALLFPSRWSLREKMNRPLIGIHDRVPAYDGDLASRVQRLFDMLRPGRPLVRANWLVHPVNELHQPKLFKSEKKLHEDTGRFWLRVERQCILALPGDGRSVFSVKTLLTPIGRLSEDERGGLIEALSGQSAAMRDYHGGADHTKAALAELRALG